MKSKPKLKSKKEIDYLKIKQFGIGGMVGYEQQAEGFGQSFVKRDKYGNPIDSQNYAINEIVTPDHKSMIGDIKSKNYTALGLDSMGLGKFARMGSELLGHQNDTSGGWGKFNKFVGTPSQQPIAEQGFAMGGIKLPNGKNAQVEKKENSIAPDGEFTQYNEPPHSAQNPNIPNANLENKEIIFSDKLKPQGSKLTFAKLNKENNTNKEDKKLEDSKSSQIAKATADLIKQVKSHRSNELFNMQEQLKKSKVISYAKNLGVDVNSLIKQQADESEQIDNSQEENSEYKYGVIKKFDPGGTYTPYEDGNTRIIPEGWDNTELNDSPESRELGVLSGQYPRQTPRVTGNYASNSKSLTQPIITNTNTPNNYSNLINTGIGLAGNLAGPAYALATNKAPQTYNVEDPRKYLQKYDPTAALNEADRQNRIMRYDARNNNGGNAASYLATLPQLQANLTNNKNKIISDYNNLNTGTVNSVIPNYVQSLNQRAIDRQHDVTANRDFKTAQVGKIGTDIASANQNYNAQEMDLDYLDYLNKTNPQLAYKYQSKFRKK